MKAKTLLKITMLVLFFNFLSGNIFCQDIILKGKLTDKADKSPLTAATVSLFTQRDSAQKKIIISDKKGNFEFDNLSAGAYILRISHSGYEKVEQKINLQASNKDPILIAIQKKATDLEGVTVVAKVAPIRQKLDTIEFSASEYKVNPDATAEDLIKKLPGLVVDKAGNVTTMGDQVKKVTVDGRDFFGDDATAALRNLPADIIDKIQVFDKLSDQAAFTGFDDGNSTKAINIVTKAGMRNGQFGRVYAGYGTDDRYSAGGNVSFFKGNRRLSIVALFNNINQQNFSTEDLLGVTSGGGGRGGGGRPGGGGGSFGGGGNNFLVGQQSGISATNALGINYSDQIGKKLTVTGSYFFNNSNTNNNQNSSTQNFIKNSSDQFYNENDISSAKNYNNRVNLRFEYKIDDKNSIIFTPTLSYQKNYSYSGVNGLSFLTATDSLSSIKSTNSTNLSGYNSNNNLLFRHAFAKKGRTISLNLSLGLSNKTGETYLNSVNQYFDTSGTRNINTDQFKNEFVNGATYSASVVYTEPIGKKGQLQLNYSPSISKNKSDLETFNYDSTFSKYSLFDTGYSNKFNNTTTSQTAGVSYRLGDRENMFTVGLSYKYLELNSDQIFPKAINVNATFNNVLPNLMWRKKLSNKSSINIMYRASTTAPSISQLQNVIDNSNTLLVTSGNPNLNQQLSNTVSARYTYTDTKIGSSFFANLFLQQASNYIANATYLAKADSVLSSSITLFRGSQLSKPINLDGYVSLRSFLTYATPIKFIKSNINFNGGITYSKTPGLVNGANSISNNYTYNTGIGLASNISQYVDFNISYSAAFTNTSNSLDATKNTNYVSQNAELQMNLLDKKGWFIQSDITNTTYTGLGAGYNQNYWLWNGGIGKKFMKNQAGEIKLSAFDILKQNNSITRTVNANYIQDVRNQVLQQYFMLTFTYKLKNFGVPPKPSNNNFPGRDRMMGPGGNRPF